jgi:hypothetical protein
MKNDREGSDALVTMRSRAQLVAAFEKLADLAYEDNEALWDEVLSTLKLQPSVQVAVAQILREGRWRNADNPKAYVATAAWHLAGKLNLLNGRHKPDQAGRARNESCISELKTVRDEDDARVKYGDRIDQLQSRSEDTYRLDDLLAEVPDELRDHDPDSPTRVNWAEVVNRTVDDERMRDSVFMVLDAMEQGVPRHLLLTRAETDGERLALQAAWRWVGRNAKSRIAPVLRGDALSTCKPKPRKSEGFVPPAEVLARLSQKRSY